MTDNVTVTPLDAARAAYKVRLEKEAQEAAREEAARRREHGLRLQKCLQQLGFSVTEEETATRIIESNEFVSGDYRFTLAGWNHNWNQVLTYRLEIGRGTHWAEIAIRENHTLADALTELGEGLYLVDAEHEAARLFPTPENSELPEKTQRALGYLYTIIEQVEAGNTLSSRQNNVLIRAELMSELDDLDGTDEIPF